MCFKKIKTIKIRFLSGKRRSIKSRMKSILMKDSDKTISSRTEILKKGQSVAKSDEFGIIPNEDRFRLLNPVALSDGAGGVGLFTGEWAEYLCSQLPAESITSHKVLCDWINSIWQPFCDTYQPIAEGKGIGAKFLSDGSWATLIAVWIPFSRQHPVTWISYGDSALFVFDIETKRMDFCSVPEVILFNDSPYLLNWKEDPSPNGFTWGEHVLNKNQVILMASDAMAQYILLQYLLFENSESAGLQLAKLEESGSRLAGQMIRMRNNNEGIDFFTVTLPGLIASLDSEASFRSMTNALKQKGSLAFDDYTLVALY